ncbi:Kinesin-like protein KIN-14T [Vitis vinifera]|uniref:Kinesin-like protein KIN-14T n=1 Tax=Vitis vinifera TaxID=29760 RepID=A0A438EM38_VITVI|nr:Kinesin-like protein KIN-14T [Vitis vinifera]
MMNMDTRKPVGNLAESIRSLLGLKANLTSSWADSVSDIIKSLPSEEPRTDRIKPAKSETTNSFDDKEVNSGTIILKLKDELAALTAYINQLNIQRRQVLNEFLDLKGYHLSTVVTLDSSNALLKLAENKSKRYSFDKVFHPGSSQDDVFLEVEPVIKTALDGYNACIFAYGQTGTGKTYTMEGTPDCPGVVPRAMEVLFKQAVDSNHAFLFSFSMLEIYLGNLKDLLVPQSTKVTDPLPPSLSVHTDPKGGIEIDNLVSIQVSDFNQALSLYRLGRRFRSTASTNSNIASSRSHCMIRITMTCSDAPERRRETNKIWMVDLGGSERVLKTKASGRRLEEGKAINLSLSALGDVINALQRKRRHIPYRQQKIPHIC